MPYGLIPPAAAVAGFLLCRDRESLRRTPLIVTLVLALAVTSIVLQISYVQLLQPSRVAWFSFARTALLIAAPGALLIIIVRWGRLRSRVALGGVCLVVGIHLGTVLLRDDLLLPLRDFFAIDGVTATATVSGVLGAVLASIEEQRRRDSSRSDY
jgi:hypothetical protein